MAIQYGNMNPLRGLAQSFATGMQLRGQRRQRPSIGPPLPDPGNADDMNIEPFFAQEKNDLDTYMDFEKKTKKNTDREKDQIYGNLIKSGAVRTPLIQEAMKKNIEPDRIKEVLDKVKNKDEMASVELNRLIVDFGGDKSPGGKAILEKLDNIKKTRVAQLKQTIQSIDEVIDNPQQFGGKAGVWHPQTMEVVGKQKNYIAELYRLDPDWTKKYLKEKNQTRKRRGGGAKPKGRLDWVKHFQTQLKQSRFLSDAEKREALELIRALRARGKFVGQTMTRKDFQLIDQIQKKYIDKIVRNRTSRRSKRKQREYEKQLSEILD